MSLASGENNNNNNNNDEAILILLTVTQLVKGQNQYLNSDPLAAPELLPLHLVVFPRIPGGVGEGNTKSLVHSRSAFISEEVGSEKMPMNRNCHTFSWGLSSPPHQVSIHFTLNFPLQTKRREDKAGPALNTAEAVAPTFSG